MLELMLAGRKELVAIDDFSSYPDNSTPSSLFEGGVTTSSSTDSGTSVSVITGKSLQIYSQSGLFTFVPRVASFTLQNVGSFFPKNKGVRINLSVSLGSDSAEQSAMVSIPPLSGQTWVRNLNAGNSVIEATYPVNSITFEASSMVLGLSDIRVSSIEVHMKNNWWQLS